MAFLRPARAALLVVLVTAALAVAACGSGGDGAGSTTSSGARGDAAPRPVIVATTPVLGAIVRSAVGDAADVRVVMPSGSDPHDWRPSARDIAEVQSADLVVQHGLGLEQGLDDAVSQAASDGVPVFTATDHVKQRGADPHFWTDPTQVRAVVAALPTAVRTATGTDVAASARQAAAELDALDSAIAKEFAGVPATARRMVTGHESLGYLAARYGLALTGTVTPSLSSQGQVSAAHLARLEEAMRSAGTRVVFTETGLPNAVADAIVAETGATLVPLGVEVLADDGTYVTYIRELTRRIASALSGSGD